ncbi:MAG: response regulator [Gemmatimonadetes bacterium]|nr:response regulator [Gemmatimonadota bacterium]MBT8405311.1 response regulator [Gemmatimonadota bacterium]NNK63336.1 response regulator [Gemmatimonadota bacterium]
MATILFVDDDEIEQLYAREILEARGHEVRLADNGEEALEIYASEGMEIDLVVTDLAMPRLNGLRLVTALKEMDPRVSILASSGRNADQLDLAQRAGVHEVCMKPWDPDHFVETIEAMVRARRTPLPAWALRPRTL